MSRHYETAQELVQDLGRLPRSRATRRELWPDIVTRLGEQESAPVRDRSAWRMPALAASVAIAFMAGMLMGRQTTLDDPIRVAGKGSSTAHAMTAALAASEREYQAAFRSLTPVDVVPSIFEAGDIEAIERSWTELHEAENALLAALREHPDNQFLGEKLLDLRAQQLEFMKQLRMLDQTSRRNI